MNTLAFFCVAVVPCHCINSRKCMCANIVTFIWLCTEQMSEFDHMVFRLSLKMVAYL